LQHRPTTNTPSADHLRHRPTTLTPLQHRGQVTT
jgi:hypothetical protein